MHSQFSKQDWTKPLDGLRQDQATGRTGIVGTWGPVVHYYPLWIWKYSTRIRAGEMMMMRTRNHLVFFFFHVLWYLSLRAPTAGDQMLKSMELKGIVMMSNI